MSWATQKIIHINNIYTCLAHSTKKVLSLNDDHKKIQKLPIEFHANEKKNWKYVKNYDWKMFFYEYNVLNNLEWVMILVGLEELLEKFIHGS